MIGGGVEERDKTEYFLKIVIYCVFIIFETMWYPFEKYVKMMWSCNEDLVKKIMLHRLCFKWPKQFASMYGSNRLK